MTEQERQIIKRAIERATDDKIRQGPNVCRDYLIQIYEDIGFDFSEA